MFRALEASPRVFLMDTFASAACGPPAAALGLAPFLSKRRPSSCGQAQEFATHTRTDHPQAAPTQASQPFNGLPNSSWLARRPTRQLFSSATTGRPAFPSSIPSTHRPSPVAGGTVSHLPSTRPHPTHHRPDSPAGPPARSGFRIPIITHSQPWHLISSQLDARQALDTGWLLPPSATRACLISLLNSPFGASAYLSRYTRGDVVRDW